MKKVVTGAVVPTLLLVVFWTVFVLIARKVRAGFGEDQRLKEQIVREEVVRGVVGYPASEKYLEDGVVYFIDFSMVDTWPDRTNNFALLRRVEVVSSVDYRHSREPRLFSTPELLVRGYYRVTRSGTNVSYIPTPGPQRLH